MTLPSIDNNVHETSTDTGTDDLSLSAVNGRQTFASAFPNGEEFYYLEAHRSQSEWEFGVAIMESGLLKKQSVVDSSSIVSGVAVAVSFSAGTKDVTSNYPASVARGMTLAPYAAFVA